jgi:asparagine synthase (glutamine-hydrolysing)
MCRIAGIYRPFTENLTSDIQKMSEVMYRGGPDGKGYFIHSEIPLALGHRRLALLDLSPSGAQPMAAKEGKYQIVYNGEIYNFREIRDELKRSGYSFTTHTDTEVVLAAYEEWGITCFSKFNGMFALALWDEAKKQLLLARDQSGIKPLYFHLSKEKGLLFASEIRAFKAIGGWKEDPDWQTAFLMFGHLPEPFTTLKDIAPLEKGTVLTIDIPSLATTQTRFGKSDFSSQIPTQEEALLQIREKLTNAVERHLISDAPIGLFLSGGIDSSLLTMLAQPFIGKNLKTLSITFEDATLNEEPFQRIIADRSGAHHESFLVTEKLFQEKLPDILEAMDQPSTDGINSYFISKYAHEYGLTAVLSGIGADELFGGYPSFQRSNKTNTLRKLPAFLPGLAELVSHEKIRKLAFFGYKGIMGEYLFNRGAFSPAQTAAITGRTQREVDSIVGKVRIPGINNNTAPGNRASFLETHLYMQNQLLKDADYMSMWHSLEIRVPFLDKEVVSLALSIDPSVKYRADQGKHLLIEAFKDILPEPIWNRKKMGFTFPFYQWMKHIEAPALNGRYAEVRNQFMSGKMHWSRYWNYLLSQNVSELNYVS